MSFSILLVYHEPQVLGNIVQYFRQKGFQVTVARELEEAEALTSKFSYSVVIARLSQTWMNSDEGLRLIDHIQNRSPSTKVILLSHDPSPELRAKALRRGAQAIIEEPDLLINLDAVAEESVKEIQ